MSEEEKKPEAENNGDQPAQENEEQAPEVETEQEAQPQEEPDIEETAQEKEETSETAAEAVAEEKDNGAPTGSVPKEIFVALCEREEINKDCLDVLKKYEIRPIIVNDPDEKRNLVEFLAEKPNVQFALTILAGDDFIYDRLTGKPGEALLSPKTTNVFCLGFFTAKFGNMGTINLYREQKSFRLPTGLHQTGFVPYQKGGAWEEILISKLREKKIL